MKILFDNEKFTTDAHGGIVRYFTELMRHYETMPDVQYDMPIARSNTEYLRGLPRFAHVRPILLAYTDFLKRFRSFAGKDALYRLWCRFNGLARENQATFSTGALAKDRIRRAASQPITMPDFLRLHPIGKPYVLTIYDMIHELHLSKLALFLLSIPLSSSTSESWRKKPAVLSRFPKAPSSDIIKMLLHVPADKIDVIYLGNSLTLADEGSVPRPAQAPGHYLLFVGNRINYKNFLRFAQAVAPLLREDASLHLLCVGATPFAKDEQALFAAEHITNKVLQVKASDQELARYYAHAAAFVFPSLYEGFGIPVLEAFACRCPAILSNTSSLPEVGGDAAVYFDPENTDSIYQAVQSVITSPDKRQEMMAAGTERLKQFSWAKTAEQTVETYRRALNG